MFEHGHTHKGKKKEEKPKNFMIQELGEPTKNVNYIGIRQAWPC